MCEICSCLTAKTLEHCFGSLIILVFPLLTLNKCQPFWLYPFSKVQNILGTVSTIYIYDRNYCLSTEKFKVPYDVYYKFEELIIKVGLIREPGWLRKQIGLHHRNVKRISQFLEIFQTSLPCRFMQTAWRGKWVDL